MKKIQKKLTAGLVVLALSFSLLGNTDHVQAAKKVKLSQTKMTLKVGTKKKLKVKPAAKKVKWSTSKKAVATVSQKGVVKAKKKGKAIITAQIGKKKLKCKVTVNNKKGTTTSESPANTKPSATPDRNNTAPPSVEITASPGQTTAPAPSLIPAEKVGAEDLTFSRGSGTYGEQFTLTMESAAGASIFYTTDGSDPRTSSTRMEYTDGILIQNRDGEPNVLSAVSPDLFDTMNYVINGNHITSRCVAPSDNDVDKCSVIKAVSCGSDGTQSNVVTNTYFIGDMSEHIDNIAKSVNAAGQNLAVISITMDQKDLFDYETGIYVKGKIFDDSVEAYQKKHGNLSGVEVEGDLTSNFKQKGRDWERNCHIEYFESDGTNTTCQLQQDCGIRIQGNYSRENVQKSFRLYAREDYGEKNFKYPFFGDELKDAEGNTMKKFKTLVLRNGGNDAFNYKYKDIFTQSFVQDRAYETLTGRPCVVYLDGEYWGYYILQDDLTDNFLETRRGVEKDNVVVYKGSDEAKYAGYGYKLDEGELPAGVTEEDYYLKETLNYLDGSHDFSDDTVYQEFCDRYLDEQSALDYFATMIYLNNGYDWPGKNWSIWRTTVKDDTNIYSDNRWRFCLFDLDLTTEPTWSSGDSGAWSKNPITSLLDKESDNVIKLIFSNMMDNASFRGKLADVINEIGTENYAYEEAGRRGTVYKNTYSVLSGQFQRRFNSNGAVYSIGEENHNANMSFLRKRLSYVPDLIRSMESLFPDKKEPVDSVLVWEGSWTRNSSSNRTDSETIGLSTVRDDSSYIQITVSDWSQYSNPVIRLTVADGYSENSRFHIWDGNKKIMDENYYQNQTEWIGKEISISDLKGETFYINVNDATLTKFEIYDKK